MLDHAFRGGTLRVAVAAFALSLAITPSAFAKGPDKGHDDDRRSIPNCSRGHDDDDDRGGGRDDDRCPGKQVLVRTEERSCPDKPGRPASVRKRVCCTHQHITYCHPFHPCPPRSRS